MATAAVSPPSPKPEPPTPPDHLPRPSVSISGDSEALCKRAETSELLESKEFLIDPALLPTLESLLLELYAMLRPKPVDCEQRHTMIDVFNKIAKDIFGEVNGFPVVEPFGSFTMDLFTAKSDLDLSVNFSSDMDGQFPRKEKISVIRKFAKVLHKHQWRGHCYGVLPIECARVPVLKVTDKGTGIECDISVENKDGMSRSMIFKLVSSIDERFQILCFLMKFWAKTHDVNCPKDRTMSSMAIISLVAFHLQTRHPPILPAFSGLLKDGADFASIQKNVSLFEGFGSHNKESVAELFVSLLSKLLAVEGLWEQGLCASNFDGFWISKTWDKGIENLSVEDFLDRSQNFARAVGKAEMQNICECIWDTVSKLTDFFKGDIDAPALKMLIFGALNEDVPVRHPSSKHGKSKRKRDSGFEKQQKKGKHTAQPGLAAIMAASILPTPTVNQQKKGKHTAQPGVAANMGVPILPTRCEKQQKKGKHTAQPGSAANMAAPILPTPTVNQQMKGKDTAQPVRASNMAAPILPTPTVKQQKKGKRTAQPGRAANMAAPILPTPTVFMPLTPVQQIYQFGPVPQHPMPPPLFAYGLPQAHLHPARHMIGHPQVGYIHSNPRIQLQQHAHHMFASMLAHQRAIDGSFYPYGFNGAQRIHYDENGRLPYGINPNYRRL